MRYGVVAIVATACHGGQHETLSALRTACGAESYWDGTACSARGDGAKQLALGINALENSELDVAKTTLDGVKGPLDHATNVSLWEQRGIAAAYLEDEKSASAAFETLLALDPGHFLSYTLSPKATFIFEKVRKKVEAAPELDVNWNGGQRVGDPVPLQIEVVADPKKFLSTATLFVRTAGDRDWHATDVALDGTKRVVLPAIEATKPVSLELYLRAYDRDRNEVLVWADPTRPREIPLRYDPPTPWYRKWWVIAIAGTVVATTTGVIVYELTLAPPDKVGGTSH